MCLPGVERVALELAVLCGVGVSRVASAVVGLGRFGVDGNDDRE